MYRSRHDGPELVPILGAGRHRNPKHGACFMEFASFLAGERWSDHPACTHPTLAALARDVNDLTSDAARARLVPHVHRVVGLSSDDPEVASAIAIRAASAAVGIVSQDRQRSLAVGILTVLAGQVHPLTRARGEAALLEAPDAARWAHDFIGSMSTSARRHTARTEAIVHTASVGIALACIDNPDERLRDLLVGAIDDAEAFCRPAEVREPALQHV